jgi:hypothetical protein
VDISGAEEDGGDPYMCTDVFRFWILDLAP